ncbi:hypothetical protein TcasGA2_TC033875 [Tribolium castaneum]|uniref:Uncharacterized protein n=1 Tax=Tribolium castaneum TaxID=7070 RepID=A0A139WFC4_TRICA|nr:hypothetical protein TcasGA2_TC033875 [Tribolium castaneum]
MPQRKLTSADDNIDPKGADDDKLMAFITMFKESKNHQSQKGNSSINESRYLGSTVSSIVPEQFQRQLVEIQNKSTTSDWKVGDGQESRKFDTGKGHLLGVFVIDI